MRNYLKLGGISFCLDAQRPLRLNPDLAPFRTGPVAHPDVYVRVLWDWPNALRPHTPPVGEDLIQIYYQEAEWNFCEMAGGDLGAMACTCYHSDCAQMTTYVNDVTCHVPQDGEGQVLRMLPMRAIFQHFGVLFLHASQISLEGKGVLFSAPSGTGKSTQARLWQRHRGAEIICADRTLLRRVDGAWRTYGYPLDGSEPVRSDKILPLGCVVLLEQGTGNSVRRLRPSQAAGALMEQSVIDGWSAGARTAALELILSLLEDIPVYRLTCTPDEGAVEALEAKLMEDEVIRRGRNL